MKEKYMSSEFVMLMCAVIFCAIAVVGYMKNNDKPKDQDISESEYVGQLSKRQEKMAEELKALGTVTAQAIEDIGKRLTEIETKKEEESLNLRLPNPIQVQLVYREAQKKVKIPPQISGAKPKSDLSTLLHKAGISL